LLGIFTHTAMRQAVLDGRPLNQVAVREFTRFSLVTVRPSETLGDALDLLTRHRIHRLVVADGEQVVGLLEALDVFGFLSGHSHQLALQIDAAPNVETLARAASQMNGLLSRLHRSGTRIGLIARLVQDLQSRLLERAWTLVAPAELVANSCLFVMGSEGRGEQLLKTDQDNALVLRDGYTPPDDLAGVCQHFSDALASFGYPPCPGLIMVSHPDWRRSQSEFAEQVRQWLLMPEADALMKLAIFLDAQPVAGDPALLDGLQKAARSTAAHSDALLARFAAAIEAFGSSQGWWNRLLHLGEMTSGMSLKKEGIFPLVHGVRSLAFQAGLAETGSAARLKALAARGIISPDQANDWTQCLHFLMDIRLKAGLAEMDRAQPVSGTVDAAALTTLERDLLKDALAVVRQFKQFLRQHFRLDVL